MNDALGKSSAEIPISTRRGGKRPLRLKPIDSVSSQIELGMPAGHSSNSQRIDFLYTQRGDRKQFVSPFDNIRNEKYSQL